MDLSTSYLGLALRNPLVASASPLSNSVDGVRRLADAGVGAVVLYSLFEEQLRREAEQDARLAEVGTEIFGEALSYFPAAAEAEAAEAGSADEPSPRRYLSLLERAVAAVGVPVIGSINGMTPGGWTGYARAMQDAGAAAIELNIYYVPGDPHVTGREVEQRYIDILGRVKDAVTVPVAVKLSPYFSSPGEMALRLDEAGADGLVLFNRFRGPAAAHLDLHLAPAPARLCRRDDRRRGTSRRGQVPAGGRRCRDDGVRADPARPWARRRPARRPVRMDGPQGISVGRRGARHAGPARGYRPARLRARRLCPRDAGRQQLPRPVVTRQALSR
jgi:dihydroorotate dehydrogenase